MLHHQHRLDQARHPRRGLQVSDVGLDSTHDERTVLATALAKHGSCRAHLNGIAERRARAVGFQIVHLVRSKLPICEGRAQQLLLRPAVRRGQAGTGTVLRHTNARNHSVDPVSIERCLVHALQHHRAAPLPAHVAVGRLIESVASAGRRRHASHSKGLGYCRREHDVHSADQSQVAVAVLKAPNTGMQRHQSGGAGRVVSRTRALEPERERHSTYGRRVGGAVGRVHAGRRCSCLARHLHGIVRGNAQEDARVLILQHFLGVPGVAERQPRILEQQALLRIHRAGFCCRDAEEARVKQLQILHKATPPHAVLDLLAQVLVGRNRRFHVPAAKRDLAHGTSTLGQGGPQSSQTFNAPWETAAHPNQRNTTLLRTCSMGNRTRLTTLVRPNITRYVRSGHQAGQIATQGSHRRVVEEECRCKRNAQVLAQLSHQLCGRQRIEPHLHERSLEVHGFVCVAV